MRAGELFPQLFSQEKYFRWRGREITRIEALSDGVFALAITLLIVSLEVPQNYGELIKAFAQLPIFAICFSLLAWVWYCQHQFFRRFGFQDPGTIAINAALLFLVLFYVYPLRFLFTVLFQLFGVLPHSSTKSFPIQYTEMPSLMLLYGFGFIGIFFLFAWLYFLAYKRRKLIELNAEETLLTLGTIQAHLISLGVGLSSVLLALLFPNQLIYSGMIYCLLGPLHFLSGYSTGKRLEKLLATQAKL